MVVVGLALTYMYTGAGISVQSGIPDFRSAHGLFQTIKRENPKENISSGKDLFDANVFNVRFLFYFFLLYKSWRTEMFLICVMLLYGMVY